MEKRFINTLILLLISHILLIDDINAQRKTGIKKEKSNVEKFILAPFLSTSHKDSIRIVTYIEIPFYSLQFIKKLNYYCASYQASIGIKDKEGYDMGYMLWTDSIVVYDYASTNSVIKNKKHFSSFTIPIGGIYEIVGELQDNDTRKKGIISKKINLKEYNKHPILLKPNFLMKLDGDWGYEADRIPTKGYRVREIGEGVDLHISGLVDITEYEIDIFISNGTNIDSLIHNIKGIGNNGFFNNILFIPARDFNSLKTDFRIVITQNKNIDEQKISFTTYKSGISSLISNIDLAFKQMRYILTHDERKQLKGKTKINKETLFYSLWKNRDPTPETELNELMEEYYRRVKYTNENFDGWQKGWESDRGMIYILFGPPDQIQRTNASMPNNSFVQIWSYYDISKQFVFRDQNGFGDYRLETPFLGVGL